MKKFISLFLIFSVVFLAVPVGAANSYIKLEPFPYSTHLPGEDIVVYGDTDCSFVTLGLFTPKDSGYKGRIRFSITIRGKDLKEGYVINTDPDILAWPAGDWTLRVQYGSVFDEITITTSEAPQYDRVLRVAEYDNSSLSSVSSYCTRGVVFKDNIISFTLEDNTEVKIYSWDNLAPADSGETTIYVAKYNEDCLTEIKSYKGTLNEFGKSVSLEIDENKTLKLLYWDDSLQPVN